MIIKINFYQVRNKQTKINVRFLQTTTTPCTLFSTSPRSCQNNNNRRLKMHYASSPRYVPTSILLYILLVIVYRDYLWNMNSYNNMSGHGTRMTTTTMNSRYYKPTHQHQDEWNSRRNTFNINDGTQRGFKQRDATSVVFASSMFFLFFHRLLMIFILYRFN